MCKEGFTDDTHTRCLGDSIDSDSGASGYLSSLAEKAADAAPDGTTVDKFLMFFLVIGIPAIFGAVIVAVTSMVTGRPIPFVQWAFRGGGTAAGSDAAGVSFAVISDRSCSQLAPSA